MNLYTKYMLVVSEFSMGILIFGMYSIVFVFVLEKFTAEINTITNQSAQTILKLKEAFAQKLIHYQEEDRKRLGEELHDNIMSRFQLMRINLFDGNLELLQKNLKKTMVIVRELSHSFAPVEPYSSTLSVLLEEYIFQIKNQLKVSYHITAIQENEMLPGKVKLMVFRIFQELISNILKHSNATKLNVQLRHSERATVLIVSDNGRGFDAEKISQGIGLKSIHYRAKIIKSNYKFKSQTGKYTVFIMYIPKNLSNYE